MNKNIIALIFFVSSLTVYASSEKSALEESSKWTNKGERPILSENGKIVYRFGHSHPISICSPLQVCEVVLEAGEKINGLHLGDKIRWNVNLTFSGKEPTQTPHIIVKPFVAGLQTTMIVTTDRRTYRIKLKSKDSGNFTPSIGFLYEVNFNHLLKRFKKERKKEIERSTIPETSHKIEDLYFGYKIDGEAPWKPIRVYHTAEKTVIQMPEKMKHSEAPALLIVDIEGEEQLVNYRLVKDKFIVDQIIDRAVMVAGVGDKQARVEIKMEERK